MQKYITSKNATEYAYEVGVFKSPNVLFEFEDGWKILELTDPEDLTECGRATKCCINSSWAGKLILEREFTEEEEREFLRESFRQQWDTPERRKMYGDAYVEREIKGADACPLPVRAYKIAALVDNEDKVRSAIILGGKEAVTSNTSSIGYTRYRDIGQDTTVPVGNGQFHLLQATYGTSWMSPETAEHCAHWWKEKSDGEWNEEAFAESVKRFNPGGDVNTYRPALAYR